MSCGLNRTYRPTSIPRHDQRATMDSRCRIADIADLREITLACRNLLYSWPHDRRSRCHRSVQKLPFRPATREGSSSLDSPFGYQPRRVGKSSLLVNTSCDNKFPTYRGL